MPHIFKATIAAMVLALSFAATRLRSRPFLKEKPMQTSLKMALYAALAFLVTAGNGEAQTSRLPGPKLAPGQVVEMIAPAVAVLSTTHYQSMLGLSCAGVSCSGAFPKPGYKRQLNITRISCQVFGTTGASFTHGYISLRSAGDVLLLAQFLPEDFSNPAFHVFNRAVDMQVSASQHMVADFYVTDGTVSDGLCTATGTLSTLQ